MSKPKIEIPQDLNRLETKETMIEIQPKAWGGLRKGAGRKRKGDEVRETIAFTTSPKTKERYNKLKSRNTNVQQLLSNYIDQLAVVFCIDED